MNPLLWSQTLFALESLLVLYYRGRRHFGGAMNLSREQVIEALARLYDPRVQEPSA
jgi:hypothetical protein